MTHTCESTWLRFEYNVRLWYMVRSLIAKDVNYAESRGLNEKDKEEGLSHTQSAIFTTDIME